MTEEERKAWDLYAAGALAGLWACRVKDLSEDTLENGMVAEAAAAADALLKERRSRLAE